MVDCTVTVYPCSLNDFIEPECNVLKLKMVAAVAVTLLNFQEFRLHFDRDEGTKQKEKHTQFLVVG